MSNQVEDARLSNQAWLDQLMTPGLEKNAVDAINDYTRLKVREDGVMRRILPMQQISNDQLDRQVDTDNPVKIVDMEPDSPAAISVGFASLPTSLYIQAPRYRVNFCRLLTPKFMKDVDQLRTWHMDIRQVFSDNSLKDLLAEEDSKFFAGVNTAMGGSLNSTCAFTGAVQWQSTTGGISRNTWAESKKIIPRSSGHLQSQKCVVNNVTINDFEKWGRDEIGGDKSQDILFQGWSEGKLGGLEMLITIKRTLVPDSSAYYFGDPRFIGKLYCLEPTVMHIKREAFMIEWYSYESIGASISNPTGLARNDYQ